MRSLFFIFSLLVAGTASAQAPAYPARPVRILVGFGAGGGIDIVARLLAQRLTDSMGQSFIVENRPGAAGSIATDLVAKAAPDGYTVLLCSVTHAINATLYSKLPYDSLRDFTPISPVARQANGISVHPSVPVKSLRDLPTLREYTELSEESRQVFETELGEAAPEGPLSVGTPSSEEPASTNGAESSDLMSPESMTVSTQGEETGASDGGPTDEAEDERGESPVGEADDEEEDGDDSDDDGDDSDEDEK